MTEPDGEPGVEPVRLILDASAICAFGVHETVGELIGEFDDEGELFAVTTASLAQALAMGADARLVDVLRANDNCVVVESTADWRSLGRFMDLTRSGPDRLHEVADSDLTMLAVRTDAYILTDRPERYTAIVDSVTTIQLEKPWS